MRMSPLTLPMGLLPPPEDSLLLSSLFVVSAVGAAFFVEVVLCEEVECWVEVEVEVEAS